MKSTISQRTKDLSKSKRPFKLILVTCLTGLLFSCNSSPTNEEKKGDSTNEKIDTTIKPTPATIAGLPDEAFWCLRAGRDTVLRWLATGPGGQDRFKKIVFKYYWPDRTQSYFTLISQKGKRSVREYEVMVDTLGKVGICSVEGLGTEVYLGGNQVSVDAIRQLWSYATDPTVTYYLKFTPKINKGRDQNGNPCNCPGHLIYQIDLVPTPGGAGSDYQPGYTNPSPPKPPAD